MNSLKTYAKGQRKHNFLEPLPTLALASDMQWNGQSADILQLILQLMMLL